MGKLSRVWEREFGKFRRVAGLGEGKGRVGDEMRAISGDQVLLKNLKVE